MVDMEKVNRKKSEDETNPHLILTLILIILGAAIQIYIKGPIGSIILLIPAFYASRFFEERFNEGINSLMKDLSKLNIFFKILLFGIPVILGLLIIAFFFIMYFFYLYLLFSGRNIVPDIGDNIFILLCGIVVWTVIWFLFNKIRVIFLNTKNKGEKDQG